MSFRAVLHTPFRKLEISVYKLNTGTFYDLFLNVSRKLCDIFTLLRGLSTEGALEL